MDAPKGLFLSGTLPRSLCKPTKRYVKTHELYQLGFVNVLPRDHEVVALRVSSKAKRKDGSYAIKDTARISVVENPHCDQTTVMSSPAKGAPSKLVEASTTMQVVEYVMDQWRLARERGHSNFPFIDHVANCSSLVQQIYGESDEERRILLQGLVEDYVLLVCHCKTIRRLNLGKMDHKRGRNFFTPLTLPANDFATIDGQNPFDIDDIPQKKRLSTLPREDQTQALHGTLSLRHEVSWDEISSQPIYGVNGRRRLHTALAELLKDVDQSLTLLRDATDFSQVAPVSKEQVKKIAGLIGHAKVAVRRLTVFSARLEKVLLEHFNWLDRTLWIRTSMNFNPFSQTRKPHNAPRNGERGEVDEANADALETDEERGDDTRELEDAIDALHVDLSRRNLDGISSWAKAAFGYISLVRLHDYSLFEITGLSENKRLSERIRDCRVAVTMMQRKEFENLHPQWARCVRYHEARNSSTNSSNSIQNRLWSDTDDEDDTDDRFLPQTARALRRLASSNPPKRSQRIDFKYWPKYDAVPPPPPTSPPSKRPRL